MVVAEKLDVLAPTRCKNRTATRTADMGETSLLILYGSQTGNSREVSKPLCEKAVAKGRAARAPPPTSRRERL